MRWSKEQDLYLVEHSHLGAKAVQRGMVKQFGIYRTEAAIISHGTRIGASWRRYYICQSCGEPTLKLNRSTHLCQACSMEALQAEAASIREAIERNQQRAKEARRKYDRDRKFIQRNEDCLKVPKKVPKPCSQQEEFLCAQ